MQHPSGLSLLPALLLSGWLYPGLDTRAADVYGTTEPFASEAIYFVLTDRFVDGDSNNNHAAQGGAHGTWQRRLAGPDGREAFVGYMGGDFKGIYDQADYIKDLGLTAVWISPIVDNPDQAFTGGSPVQFGSGVGADGGKTGYHGYWGVDFYRVDEHLESPGFSFQELAGQRAAFYRVYQKDGVSQTALVLLNKGGGPADFTISDYVSTGTWRDAASGEQISVSPENRVISVSVDAHDVRVLLFDEEVNHSGLAEELTRIMATTELCAAGPVSVEPDLLQAGQTATISYRRSTGDEVALHWGIDNWSGTSTPQDEVLMERDPSGLGHSISIQIPAEATQLDFVFHNLTQNRWDINGGQDWHFFVSSDGTQPQPQPQPEPEPEPQPELQSRFGTDPALRLTGEAFASWNPANTGYELGLAGDFRWEGAVVVDQPLIQTPYKLTLNGEWTVNWGGGAGGSSTQLPRGGANATVTLDAGRYLLRVDEGSSVSSPVQVEWLRQDQSVSRWWTGTNIYQVYVQQFGGNLPALEQRLDYLQGLGAKTLWLMPIFASMSDHGYDATDYYAIKEEYGTVEDLRSLVQSADRRGMRVILDLVMNHLGFEHPWFSSENAAERMDHWFVWSHADQGWNKPWGGDGGPGVTWFQDPQAHLDRDGNGTHDDDDFYYTVFSPTMPDFNYNDPVARSELIDEFVRIMRFWIERTGVHGFRCDAVRYMVETGAHSNQRKDQDETHALWKTVRARLAEIDPEAILLAEAPTEEYDQMRDYYGTGDEFHTAFHFKLPGVLIDTVRSERRNAHLLADLYAIQAHLPPGTQDTIFLSNHDSFAGDRVATQLGGHQAKMKAAASLYLLLSGNPAIYYGEEIGMEGGGSDDAIRQPMNFEQVQTQLATPASLLNHYTRLLRIRDKYDALRGGISYFVPSHDRSWDCRDCEANRLALIREWFGAKVLVVHNFRGATLDLHLDLSPQSTGLDIPDGTQVHALMGQGVYPPVSESNRSFYPVGGLPGFGSIVLFLGDIDHYQRDDGSLLTYENAVEGDIEPVDIPVSFTCENGHTVPGQSVYAVGNVDALGGFWNTAAAPILSPTQHTIWTGVIELPSNSCVEWKCIVREESGDPPAVLRWQPGPNNLICTPASGSASTFGQF